MKTHLQAEVIDLQRTKHYERMLAVPVGHKSVEEHLREDNAQLSAENAKLKQELNDALQQVESLRREMAATRSRSRMVLETCLKPFPRPFPC